MTATPRPTATLTPTAASTPTPPLPFGLCNLGDILRLPAQGDAAAVIDLREGATRRSLSAVEFDALTRAIGRGLLQRGLKVGTRIGILAENRLEFIACYFGIMRVGAVAVPVNHKLPRSTIEHIFRDSAIEWVFCDGARRALVPPQVPVVDFDSAGADGFEAFLDAGDLGKAGDPGKAAGLGKAGDFGRAGGLGKAGDDDTWVPVAAAGEPGDGGGDGELAEILYTSGSTGLPKGVPLGHYGQLWAIAHYLEPLLETPPDERPPQDTTIIVAPFYHMNGLFNVSVALARRVAVLLLPRFDARRYLEAVSEHRCTMLSGIPTMFALMVREHDLVARLDFTSVRDVTIGSAPLTDALLDQVRKLFPNAEIRNGYGTTEAGPAVFGPHPDGLPRPGLALGVPFPDVECALVDGPSADHGNLSLRTAALTRGYLNQPNATAARIRDGWYLTGDVMRRDAQGFYYFVGRADDMFVCGGENVYPGEIEKLLERHPDVAQAIVVAAPDDIKGQIPVAFIVPRAGRTPSVEAIKQHALNLGPAYAHPRFVEFEPELPVSGTHKIDRTALTARALAIVRAAGRSETPPTGRAGAGG
jgi:acyl-CoA synthetase (AMP-forming)/AMP-acid ligase II